MDQAKRLGIPVNGAMSPVKLDELIRKVTGEKVKKRRTFAELIEGIQSCNK
jgi:hypothetical protein